MLAIHDGFHRGKYLASKAAKLSLEIKKGK
jgi:hypothetical protein